ncbi:MAG: exodeoxyribonuclease VII small subunit [Gammaproteobacteria bacterium]|nr:exodeoxyribonuclease VII small subunit [Gammaproteobacteria bacterium]
MPKKTTPSFATSLKKLESIVEKIESDELPLESALSEFEQGIKLANECQQTLKSAEQKVQILLSKQGEKN